MVLSGYVATLLQPAWIELFKDMSEEQIDDVLERLCPATAAARMRDLLKIMRKHMSRPA